MIGGRGGVWVLWLAVWLSSWGPFNLVIPVAGQQNMLCVRLASSDWTTEKIPAQFSIGAERFKPYHHLSIGFAPYHVGSHGPNPHFRFPPNKGSTRTCGNNGFDFVLGGESLINHPDVDFCGKGMEIQTSLVRQNGRVLRGWLHFEVKLVYPLQNDVMKFIYAQVRDETFNAIGEFVSNNEERCTTNNSQLLSPSEFQYLPCSATSPREPKTSQAIFMASIDEYANKAAAENYTKPLTHGKGIHFTWRMGEYSCNRHQKFRLDVHVLPASNVTDPCTQGENKKHPFHAVNCRNRRFTTDWIHLKWFGAADIKLPGPLDCTVPLLVNGKLSKEADAWIEKNETITVGNDYVGQLHNYTCGTNGTIPGSSHYVQTTSTFGGRCNVSDTTTPSRDHFHRCQDNGKGPKFPSYTEYLNNLTLNRTVLCSKSCRMPSFNDSDDDLLAIKSFPTKDPREAIKKPKISYETVRTARTEQREEVLWYTRKYHGNLCIFFTLGLLSVSNFVIRYYKETFMDNLALGCAPWFWLHMAVCFWVPVLYHSGHASMAQSIENFGVSQSVHAVIHRTVGKIFVAVFCLMVAFGAFRPLFRGARMLSMTIHAVSGFVLYLLAIFLIINSTFIPGSPTLKHCDSDGLPTGYSFTFWMAIAWLLIDLAFHLLLTIFQFALDRKYDIVRAGFGLPIVPLLPAESSRDLVGSRFRKIVLVFYVTLALVMTFATMIVIFKDDDRKNCTLGPMDCDLNEIRPFKDSSPFGCSDLAKKYYNKVIAKYEPQTQVGA